MTVQRQIDRLIAQRASEWVETLKTAGPAEREAFVDWLRESRRHVEEFLTMVALERELDHIDLEGAVDRQALLARIGPSVTVLPPTTTTPWQPHFPRRFPLQRFGLAAAAGIAALTLATLFISRAGSSSQIFVTREGERRSVELSDGSVVQLNASTQVHVRLTHSARELELMAGEALFKVARDNKRPFRVHTRDALVQALGTQFNIDTRPAGTTVSVIEGKVQVSQDGSRTNAQRAAPTALGAGEVVTIALRGRSIERRQHVDVARAVAWRQQRLVFQSAPLEYVVQEFNRHNAAPKLKLTGVDKGSHHYSATFDADDPESFADLLGREADLIVERRGDELVIRERN